MVHYLSTRSLYLPYITAISPFAYVSYIMVVQVTFHRDIKVNSKPVEMLLYKRGIHYFSYQVKDSSIIRKALSKVRSRPLQQQNFHLQHQPHCAICHSHHGVVDQE